jgi:Domain of unknown function (DUF4296)
MRLITAMGIIILLVSVGCTNQYKVPSDILPKEKMEAVLWDMIVADRYSAAILVKDTTKKIREETFKLYEQVFSIHKVSRQQFIKSFKWYLERPDIAQVMLDSLAAGANRRREEMYKPSAK